MEHHDMINLEHSDGEFVYKIVRTEEQQQRVIDFYFDIFMNDEPFMRAMGGYERQGPELEERLARQQRDIFANGTSVMAVEQGTGRLAGMMTVMSGNKDYLHPDWLLPVEEQARVFPFTQALTFYLMPCFDKDSALARYPEAEKLCYLLNLGTHPDFRGRGVATRMVKMGFTIGKDSGADLVLMMTSSNHSRM